MSSNVRTDCFFNLTTDERIDLFKRRQGLRIDNVFRTFFGWVVLPLALLGVLLVTLFILATYRAIKARVVSRKCYILLLNRAVGDLVSCIVALLVCGYVLMWHEINRDMVILMESFFIGSFWSAMVSYVALSVLKLFAVWKPFQYRKWFTMKRCINLIIFSWVMFILMISYTLGISALVKIPSLNEWSGCRMETCLRNMYRARNFVTVSVYAFTLSVFFITVLLIRRAQKFVDSFKKRDSTKSEGGRRVRFPLWKLALNVGTFAGLYLFYVIWCVGLVINQDQCFFQRNYAEMMRILAIVRCTLLLRILVDPILSFATDYQVSNPKLLLQRVECQSCKYHFLFLLLWCS
ncbi:unnamed protein product [Haemonchus placei]|uniref:G_PROTEIN_RECEP_F1_2 domain-containing protein n=1 Tax=Haemonchus placei TaxID=6290 RepID=A0A0N4WYD2_HAEPC|nr:unnamed protein product [Haemonchus placei]